METKREVEGMVNCIEFPVDNDVVVRENLRAHRYEFDAVFSPGTNQGTVFKQIEDTIVSVMDGYNVCIFAYGQTGSGKTYVESIFHSLSSCTQDIILIASRSDTGTPCKVRRTSQV